MQKLYIDTFIYMTRGVRCRVDRVVDLEPLAGPDRCGFKSRQGLWILSCEERRWFYSGARSYLK